ncbi:MAG: radical SAM protein [Armatimonadetes bacterium]|nr:radical SAM protein [Armatimonadota bacterium]
MAEDSGSPGPFYILELTQRCNHVCPHCYNVWKLGQGYPGGELDTSSLKKLVKKLKDETDCRLITLSGGEPLLRKDFFEILSFIHSLDIGTVLITNGSLVTPEKIGKCLEYGVQTFELPLLSYRREMHNAMSGAPSFDKVVDAIAEIKKQKGTVVSVFVATRKNIQDFEKTVELAFALGVDGFMLNRFNPGGAGVRVIEELLPSVESLREVLEKADELSAKYALSVSCSIPMQPCIFDFTQYPRLGTGFCAAGTKGAYYTFDPIGNMRPCNHSTTILGNFLERTFAELLSGAQMKEFTAACPSFCDPCPKKDVCLGGCKAAAQVCFGDVKQVEPFLKRGLCELGAEFKYPAA